ncbi:helix-turn-helix transcriptional regulator [Paenibacillus glucanolyticus]|nr:helix-turn-helix transcriptional regulator [Paenibacillus glucanolyticus]
MMKEVPSKKLLGDFLRSRRERLSPEDVGLASYGRRRTSGLRREEVAQLAHIGTSWYTSLEQGRCVNPSEDVLNNIANALQLTEDEREHLHLLAKPAQQERADNEQINMGLEQTIRALEPNPAFILNRYWDLLIWNRAAAFVFLLPPFSNHMQQRTNWLKHLLTGGLLGSDKYRAQVVIAQFRADYAYLHDDPRFNELIEELMKTSQLFCELWPLHDVQAVTDRYKRSYDPHIGEMEFEHVILQPSKNPDLKIMIYTASTDTAARLKSLISTL